MQLKRQLAPATTGVCLVHHADRWPGPRHAAVRTLASSTQRREHHCQRRSSQGTSRSGFRATAAPAERHTRCPGEPHVWSSMQNIGTYSSVRTVLRSSVGQVCCVMVVAVYFVEPRRRGGHCQSHRAVPARKHPSLSAHTAQQQATSPLTDHHHIFLCSGHSRGRVTLRHQRAKAAEHWGAPVSPCA